MGKRGKLPKNRLPVENSPCVATKPTKDDEARERRYRAQDALRTLQQADDYRQNKQLMGDIKALAKEQMETAKKFAK